VEFGHSKEFPATELFPSGANRLFFGDNLHIMRQLPSKSIDLIYIDPPFFSGRNYNVIFGDKNEVRSFSDIWEGGMPGYLVWLNARLYEMKRLLKPTGSIFIHLDWHASHYVKVEMDKIYGYGSFRNEILWYYYNKMHDRRKGQLPNACDVILWYTKTGDYKHFELKEVRDQPVQQLVRKKVNGKMVNARDAQGNVMYREATDRTVDNVWRIPALQPADNIERVGYPTQKPLELTQRIIELASEPGDVVADFFCGGGGFIVSAQGVRVARTQNGDKTKKEIFARGDRARRWVASDQSRIAVAITADRLTRAVEEKIGSLFSVPDFTIEHWGIYESPHLEKLSANQFRKFVVEAFGGRPESVNKNIHGLRQGVPLYVGEPSRNSRIDKEDVKKFAQAIFEDKRTEFGVILGWNFAVDARKAAEILAARENKRIDFVRLTLVRLEDKEFREHVISKHKDYEELLSFIQPPEVRVAIERIGPRTYRFDVSESVSLNPDGVIANVQWDFSYRERFSSTQGYAFLRDKSGKPILIVEYEFETAGKKKIACSIQDNQGGERTWISEIEVH
jgi:DNA modification methylase